MKSFHPNYRVNPALTTALFCNNPDCLRPRKGGFGVIIHPMFSRSEIRYFCSTGCIREFYMAPNANSIRINMYLKKIPLEQGEAKPGEGRKEREASDKEPPCLSAGEAPTGGGAGANPPSNSAASRSRKNDDPYEVSGYEGTEGME